MFRAAAEAPAHGCRGRQAEGVRTGDDYSRDGEGEGAGKRNPCPQLPGQERDYAGASRDDDQIGRRTISNALAWGFGVLSRLNQLGDLSKDRIASNLGCVDSQRARCIDRTSDDRIARALLNGQALPCDESLVHSGRAGKYFSVNRDLLARFDDQRVPHNHILSGNLLLLSIPNDDRHGWHEIEQGTKGI